MDRIISPKHTINGEIKIPSDKSITHRAIMLSSISKDYVTVKNPLLSEDTISTINCMRNLGVNIDISKNELKIKGVGLHGLKKPPLLNSNNSGTTMRLLTGILCGQNFSSEITGDSSLINRPMDRIIIPLSKMGASIRSKYDNKKAPLIIDPPNFIENKEIFVTKSAQVKSSILFFGLYSPFPVSVKEKFKSRNHTYLMLKSMGASIKKENDLITLNHTEKLNGNDINIPSDISSASYFIALALLLKNSEILIKNVGINKTRIGILNVLKRMNADIKILNKRKYNEEDVGDILIKSSYLKSTIIKESEIPLLIDEIPVLSVLMALSEGKSKILGASELKYKESNRLSLIYKNLKNMGAKIKINNDNIEILGVESLKGAKILTKSDHRIAMAFTIAGLVADNDTKIKNSECVNISYPEFFNTIEKFVF